MPFDLTLPEAIDRAQRLIIGHRYPEGLRLLEAAVHQYPHDPEIRLLYGTVLIEARPDDAPHQLAEAIRLDMNNPVRLTRAARLLFTLGYVDAASSYIGRAIDLTPNGFEFEAEMINVSGLIAAARGEAVFAEEALQEAVVLDPTNEFFVRDLARFLVGHDRRAQAIELIDRSASQVRDGAPLLRLRRELAP